jgi:transposase
MARYIKIDKLFWEQYFINLSKEYKNIQIKLLCLHHVQQGRKYKEVAKLFGISARCVQVWVNKYAKDGIDGILPKIRKSRSDKVSEAFNILEFKEEFLKEQKEKAGGRLTGTDAKRIIEEKFNCKIGLSTTYRVLHEVNLSYVTGRDINPNTNEEEQLSFKKTLEKM